MQLTSGIVALRWGVKESFLRYLARTPGSDVRVSDGARYDPEFNEFEFPAATTPRTESFITFAGEVTFVAHAGVLRLRLAKPALDLGHTPAQLTFVVTTDAWRTPVAEVSWPPAAQRPDTLTLDARLAPEAVELFDGVYVSGTSLSSVRLLAVPDPS